VSRAKTSISKSKLKIEIRKLIKLEEVKSWIRMPSSGKEEIGEIESSKR
jgi:hypothetical protein